MRNLRKRKRQKRYYMIIENDVIMIAIVCLFLSFLCLRFTDNDNDDDDDHRLHNSYSLEITANCRKE